jgi:hypothetical protein
MTARRLAALSFFVVLLGTFAWADLLPIPRPPVPSPQPEPRHPVEWFFIPGIPVARGVLPTLDPATQIRLESAAVGVRIVGQETSVVAHVTARFHLVCVDAPRTPGRFTIAFPLSLEGEDAEPLHVRATVDGAQVKSLRSHSWQGGSDAEPGPIYRGCVFESVMGRGDAKTVVIHYALRLPVVDQRALFTYVLHTGASWHGTIGRETVRVVAERGLSLQAEPSRSLKPLREAAREILWELRNAEPVDDIRVVIAADPAGT